MTPTTPQELKVASVVTLWKELLPFEPPDQYTITRLVLSHGVDTMKYAVKEVTLKRLKLNGEMDRAAAIRLCYAICCSVTRQKAHLARIEVR